MEITKSQVCICREFDPAITSLGVVGLSEHSSGGREYNSPMTRLLTLLACAIFLSHAQDRPALADILGFESPAVGTCPGGWSCNPPDAIAADSDVVHGGKWSVRIERQAGRSEPFSGVLKNLPIDFGGKTVELRGFIRTENVEGFSAFWIREDGANGPVGFVSMQGRDPVKGATPWTEHTISLPVNLEARTLFFGFLLNGTGKAWADDLQLLVDGQPIWDAPKVDRPKTVFDTDHEFDGGSRIALTGLSASQVGNLVTLGKVWGFLKYHYPAIVSGTRHFDYDLFRVLPSVLAAPDRTAASAALVRWIDGLGELAACQSCAKLKEDDLYLRPDLSWISDEHALGADLSRRLQKIHENRPAASKQFYVSLLPNVANPSFDHEPAYPNVRLPDEGVQILALYRFWNIIEYWYPYRGGIANWDAVLAEFLPRIALAKDRNQYQLAMMAFIAKVNDTHANLWSSLAVRPPVGACQLPVTVRFVEDQAVVAGYSNPELGRNTGLKPGDVIEQLDGVALPALVKEWTPYYADSNQAARLRDIARSMTHGDCAKPATLEIRRGSETLNLNAARVAADQLNPQSAATHDRPGDAFRLLSPDVAYLKLSSVKSADAASYVESAAGTKGLIIDIRNYPSQFMVFALGNLLAAKPVDFARITNGDISNPGAFHWGAIEGLTPQTPHYAGKVVILLDEISQSQAEYTAMAFRAAGGVVLGSTTAGADGNVSQIPLPGGLSTMISGLGVFYPDRKPTQRIGILPDQEAKPTVAGIRDGRDEVLEAAIRRILGPNASETAIRKLANGQ
jgi:C-terminal processing protease CtpA/Prc